MVSYLAEVKNRLVSLRNGMTKNPTFWTDTTVSVQSVEQMLANLETKDTELEEAKNRQALKITEAREVSGSAGKLADKIENFAGGYHAGSEEKLVEYGIKQRKTATPKPAPTKTLIPVLQDDTDGEGFIVSTQVDLNADYYEWQKGTGTNAADDKTIPELKNFKVTKKTSFVDDDIPKGVRIFYRVRAANTNGVGPWSEAVSRVQ
jgi:hypothetical protein